MDVTNPPEGQGMPNDLSQPAPPMPSAPPTAGPSDAGPPVTPPPPADTLFEPMAGQMKPKTDVGFFILGFVSPWIISTVWSFLMSAIGSVLGQGATLLSVIATVPMGALFFVFLYLFFKGKSSGNVRMTSYGKGALWSYAVTVLLGLLAFGTCFIALSNQP